MNNQELLDVAKTKVGSVAPHHRHAYSNGMALRQLLEENQPAFALNFELQGPADPLRTHANMNHVFTYLMSDHAGRFLRISQAHEIFDASQAFKDACKILDPLVAEVRRLEELILDEQAELCAKTNELREAEEAAMRKAQEIAAADPAVIAARERLEALQNPPALIRGRQKLATV
jgi:hypothetical protein